MVKTILLPHPFVVLESRDGCGKTSISQKLSEILGANLVKTPAEPEAQFRKFYDSCENFEARYLYYVSTLVLASEEISKLLQFGPVVCDRYIKSTVIYHQLLGVDTAVVDIEKLDLVTPTLTVCLTCNEEVLAKRMRERGEHKEDHIEDRIDLLTRVNQLMCSEIPTHIDTSNTTPVEAAQLIAAML